MMNVKCIECGIELEHSEAIIQGWLCYFTGGCEDRWFCY